MVRYTGKNFNGAIVAIGVSADCSLGTCVRSARSCVQEVVPRCPRRSRIPICGRAPHSAGRPYTLCPLQQVFSYELRLFRA